MTKHTPGPWVFEPSTPEDGINCWFVRGRGSDAREVVEVGAINGPQHLHEANARLIASAPDMLDALKDALATFEFWRPPQSDYVVQRVRDAIEQATKGYL